MYAASSTEVCLRRGSQTNIVNPVKFCDEMADFNYFYTVKERRNASDSSSPKKKENIAVVAVRYC